MRVLVLGASGIIGQHMRLCVPEGVTPIWARKTEDLLHCGIDFENRDHVVAFLGAQKPDAIVNLAGESRPDVVEQFPERYLEINAVAPEMLSEWCRRNNAHYVHVSTQAVFSGTNPPYHENSQRAAVNHYGAQKIEAEQRVERHASHWTIVRPTFVLGIRPLPGVGRENPAEQIIVGTYERQVADRFFSISFARDVAVELWRVAIGEPQMKKIHAGIPYAMSRYQVARALGYDVEPASHDDFVGIAPRPLDTTYVGNFDGAVGHVARGLEQCVRETSEIERRNREIAIFAGHYTDRLNRGFMTLHNEVTADFKRFNPKNDDELLEWYRTTDAYIWELSAYHIDPGFNYIGMVDGIVTRLKNEEVKKVLCLGDGIGDMTLACLRAGLDAAYHDLAQSRTARYANMRIWSQTGKMPLDWSNAGWTPPRIPPDSFDAIVASDFLEHVTDVEAWVKMVKMALRPGGLFFAQNAFACGSGDDGPMPMHLARNDHYEKDWDPLLANLGFEQLSDNWYRVRKLESTMAEPYASVVSV